MHVSNRHLDLVPMVAATAAELGVAALVRHHPGAGLAYPSTWVVMGPAASLRRLRDLSGWQLAQADGARPWTDDYSSLVAVWQRD